MRLPGEILLVSTYELGHQPWNLASPLAFLEREGFAPDAIDTAVTPLDDARILGARLVAISVPMHTAMRLGERVARRVRELNPGVHICFYGLYAWLNHDYLVPAFGDSTIGGEYERPLAELAHALDRGEINAPGGVGSATGRAGPHLSRLDFAEPARDALPTLENYARYATESGEALAGYVEASRGCLHVCRHCPITPVYHGRFFVVPVDVVLADIRRQVAAGARHITFGDPDFLNGPGHVLKILRRMREEFPELTFDATIKIEHVLEHASLFPTLAELGCSFVVSAVESFSDHVLDELAKGHLAADVARALEITREAGITLRPTFVAFTPWTTLEDYIHLLHRVEELGIIEQVDPVQYSIRLLIPPQSALLDRARGEPWLGSLEAHNFTYRWAHPDPRMDALAATVGAYIEEAICDGRGVVEIFYGVKALAFGAAGLEAVIPDQIDLPRRVAPGLTESWFC